MDNNQFLFQKTNEDQTLEELHSKLSRFLDASPDGSQVMVASAFGSSPLECSFCHYEYGPGYGRKPPGVADQGYRDDD